MADKQQGLDKPAEVPVVSGQVLHKREETALIESEAKYRALFEQARDSILLLEIASEGEPVIRDANAAALRMHGYSREELLGKPISFLDADAPASLIRERVGRIQAAKSAIFEARHRRKDGSVFDIEVSVREIEVDGKRLLLDISRDVTERKRAEGELKLNSEIFENITEGVCLVGFDDGIIKYLNPRFEKMFGYDAGELAGKSVSVINAPAAKTPEETKGEILNILRRTGEWHGEIENIKKDGTLFWCYANVTVVDNDRFGRVCNAIMTLFPPDWMFTSGNPATVEMFGAKDEADFSSNVPWNLSPEYQPDEEPSSVKAKLMIETAMEKGSHFFEWTHKKIGGQDFPATVLLTRIELGGKTGLQATVRNIAAQKRVEREREKLRGQLLQSQKMEAVGLLAGGVAHDFNNILTAIKCYADEFVNKDLSPQDPKLADMQEILGSVERAIALTRQLLAFSRRQIMAPRVVDLNRILGNMTNMLRRIIGENIALETGLFSAPCKAMVDPGQIEQVIMNLAVNARAAMPDGGTLILETEILRPPEEFFIARPDLPKGQLVCIRVRDTGCGMNEEVKSRLFEPFFTTKEQGKGTGLGLSMVFGIVKQSRGEIEVESEPG
ncbi:MAG: PAS domain S-box protein, partial [Elusimicrobia bacterium]|nr:PAS domain S-box protein [Elusimicrobiota bacterium]